MTAKILVTGATGATGKPTVKFLLEHGFPVRAVVRKQDARADELKALGAEIFQGDLLDYDSVRQMVKGVHRAYFCFPIRPGKLIDATTYFAQAAGEEGLEAIVNMSQKPARQDAKSHASQNHWVCERVFDHFETPVTHIKPTFFAEWFLYFAPMVKQGHVQFPFGTGKHAPITAEDQGRVIAGILANPEPHRGKSYPLYGAKEMTVAEQTEALGKALNKQIKYTQVSMDEFVKIGSPMRDGLFTPYFVQHVEEVSKDHANGLFSGMNDYVEKIGGHKPTTIEQFAQQYAKAFT